MVITARLASTSAPQNHRRWPEKDGVSEKYQKALQLLQDPILPVRAHGLILLREIVSERNIDPGAKSALLPAIQSIFLQSVYADDSYIFLNAVQGLATLAEQSAHSVLRTLLQAYSAGMDAGSTDQNDLDSRLRIGEALSIVIKHLGSALSLYGGRHSRSNFALLTMLIVDVLIPPLLQVFRSRHIPTVMRTSALSLLADCENVHSLSVQHYVQDLAEGVIDLLQVEKAPTEAPLSLDSQPMTTTSKIPPLRRAAIHFLTVLVQNTISHICESTSHPLIAGATIRRAKITLSYLAATDHDSVVRVMSRECGDKLEELQKIAIGF